MAGLPKVGWSSALRSPSASSKIKQRNRRYTHRLNCESLEPRWLLTTAPVAADDGLIINPGDQVVIDVLDNDFDLEANLDPTTVQINAPPSQATSISVDPVTGEITYEHDGSALLDSFSYTVSDTGGLVSNSAIVNLGLHGQPLPLTGLADEVVFDSGFSQAISMAFLPDGRQLILQKDGLMWIADPDSGGLSEYMRITNINTGGERGLLDITLAEDFDPALPGDDYFYVYYTPASPQRARVARFTHQELEGGLTSEAATSSEFVVWEDTDEYITCCHYGGGLDFGPDGKLWLTASDKFTAPNPGEFGPETNHPRDLTKAGGKVIRMNPDGSVPDGTDGWAANPYLDPVDDDPVEPGNQNYYDYIWAYGLRNPFRARWDIPTGRFYMAEVGGNQQSLSYEDLHVARLDLPAADYGWNNCEGPGVSVFGVCDPNHEEPIFSYPHGGTGASITGGEVYRGDQFAPEWQGVYFYGDFTRDFTRYLTIDDTGQVTGDHPLKPSAHLPDDTSQVVFIGTGVDGALYYVLLGGEIGRITQPNRAQRPSIDLISADTTAGPRPLLVNFSASVSDPNGDDLTFAWRFGDGTNVTGNVIGGTADLAHTFDTAGLYETYLEISDGTHTTYSEVITIMVGPNEPPVINEFGTDVGFGDPPLAVTFTADVSDANGDDLTYIIDFGDGETSGLQTVPPTGQVTEIYTYEDIGTFDARLTVFDGTTFGSSDPATIVVGPSSLPPVTNDLVLLLESDIKVPVTSGSTVAGWVDGSGWGNSLDASGDPQIVLGATPGGLPAIVFDGTDDKLERLASETINQFPAGNDDRTVFTVVSYIDTLSVDSGFSFGRPADNEAFGLVANGTAGELTVQGYGTADFASNVVGEGAGWMIQSAVLDGSNLTHYQDGTSIDNQTHVYATDVSNATDSRIVLAEELGGAGFGQLEVAAVLVYNRALGDIERQQVEDYLNSKYFLGNLPPVANDDAGLVARGGNVRIDALANDSDNDGVLNEGSVTIVTSPNHGTLLIDPATGAITYSHDHSTNLTDTFSYTVTDELGALSNVATVDITVGAGALVTDGLIVALESDAGIAFGNGTEVVGWLDSSGRGNDLQTVVGDPQLTSFITPSGQAAVSFDGDDSLARIDSIDPLNGFPEASADRSIFLVARYDNATQRAGAIYGNAADNEGFGLAAGADGFLAIEGGSETTSITSDQPGVGEGWLVQSVQLSADVLNHYRDGRLIDQEFQTYDTMLERLVLAGDLSGLNAAQMDIAAVMVYDRALGNDDRQRVEAYLFDKYLTNLSPQFTSETSISISETTSQVVELAVNDPEPASITYSISGGADAALFELTGAQSEQLSFMMAPDFETPLDADMDNVYEVQVSATDGIDTVSQDVFVTVTDVSTPLITLDVADAVNENDVFLLSGTVLIDETLSTITLDLDWGDPLSPNDTQQFVLDTNPLTLMSDGIDWDPVTQSFAIEHQYLDDNPTATSIDPYTLQVSATDSTSTGNATSVINVNNVAPAVAIQGAPATIDEGNSINLTSMVSDVGTLDSLTYDWQVTRNSVPFLSSTDTFVDFFADDNATFEVMLTVADDDGGFTVDTATIVVEDVRPVITADGPDDVDEASPYMLSLSDLMDPGNDTVSLITISWGDNSPLDSATPADLPLMLSHVYDDGPVSTTITVSALDEDGFSVAASRVVNVFNVNPTAVINNGGDVDEGDDGLVQFFLQDDVSPDDVLAGFSYSYDFDNDGVFDLSSVAEDSALVPGEYLQDDPDHTVRARIEDKDGGFLDLFTTISVNNVAPLVEAGADVFAAPDAEFQQEINIVDPGNDAPWTIRIDWDGDLLFDETLTTNDRDFSITHTYGALDLGQTYTVTVEADDGDGGVDSDTFDVFVREDMLRVKSFDALPNGFQVTFNRAIGLSELNLYDGNDLTSDAADLQLIGQTSGPVMGSMVWDPISDALTFVKTGGLLVDDDYTVTLFSSTQAFQDPSGQPLDGDNDFVAGGDFVNSFTIAQSGSRVVGIGDFARGPDQAVDLTPADANDDAMPIVIDVANGVTAVDVHVHFDPNLLQVDSVTKAIGLPSDWIIAVNDTVPGEIRLTASGSPLSGTNIAIFDMDASIPTAAPYGVSQIVRLDQLRLNEDAIPGITDSAFHHVSYLGDVTGDAQFTALDASYVSRVVVGLDSGFDAHPLVDPLILGDATGDGTLSGQDAFLIAQEGVGIPRPEIPDDPDANVGMIPEIKGASTVSIDSGVYFGNPGDVVDVLVDIDDAQQLLAADFVIQYDPSQLALDNDQISIQSATGGFLDGWSLVTNADTNGMARFAIYSSEVHTGGPGTLAELSFEVLPSATSGTTPLELNGRLNEGELELFPVDGDLTVISGDFDNDGQYTCTDIDALVAEIAAGTNNPTWDLNADGFVDLADRNRWLAVAALVNGLASPYLLGDANLDGVVDGLDFIEWNDHKFTFNASWCSGDFSANGIVDAEDFILWNQNKFQSSDRLPGLLVSERPSVEAAGQNRAPGSDHSNKVSDVGEFRALDNWFAKLSIETATDGRDLSRRAFAFSESSETQATVKRRERRTRPWPWATPSLEWLE